MRASVKTGGGQNESNPNDNGSNGTTYGNFILDSTDVVSHGILPDNYAYYSNSANSIQNGGPDGMAVTHNGSVSEFISYEGSFTATDGPALGMTSTNILVSESNSTTPINSSLQRVCFSDTWILTEGFNTMGQVNTGCTVPIPGAFLLTCMGLGLMQAASKHIQ